MFHSHTFLKLNHILFGMLFDNDFGFVVNYSYFVSFLLVIITYLLIS